VRDTLYPLDRKGSSRFWNRAGDKLMQLVESVELLTSLRSTTFIDVCGGPGAFTQLILRYKRLRQQRSPPRAVHCTDSAHAATSPLPRTRLGKQPCRGYGMTLRMPNTPKSDAWYPMLENDPNFTISFGVDGTGIRAHPPLIKRASSRTR
jgi:hypothetical protein